MEYRTEIINTSLGILKSGTESLSRAAGRPEEVNSFKKTATLKRKSKGRVFIVKQVCVLTVNHRGPLPFIEGTSLFRRNNSVEGPWRILGLFVTYDCM